MPISDIQTKKKEKNNQPTGNLRRSNAGKKADLEAHGLIETHCGLFDLNHSICYIRLDRVDHVRLLADNCRQFFKDLVHILYIAFEMSDKLFTFFDLLECHIVLEIVGLMGCGGLMANLIDGRVDTLVVDVLKLLIVGLIDQKQNSDCQQLG